MDPQARWWSKVDKQPSGCWLWTGALDRHGYGQFDVTTGGKRTNHRAHRWGYQQFVRPLDDNETIDHLCRVRACVNFEQHLEPVPHAENVARGQSGQHNAVKTHCPQGHEYTPENTAPRKGGGRTCIACRNAASREAQRKRRGYQGGITSGDKTHCIHGHEFTEANTIRRTNGGRGCRECGREANRLAMRRRRARPPP